MSDFGKLVPYVKRKWVKALRSGEYKQAHLALKRQVNDRYEHCCLGVLVEEMRPEGFDSPNRLGLCVVDGKDSVIPDDLATLWGLTRVAQGHLITLNDPLGSQPFPVIADWIEANL